MLEQLLLVAARLQKVGSGSELTDAASPLKLIAQPPAFSIQIWKVLPTCLTKYTFKVIGSYTFSWAVSDPIKLNV